MLQLRFTVDGDDKVVPLAGSEVRFGRSGDNEVVLPDYSVSRRHAAVRREADGWSVHDLNSTNGVQVNEASVQQARIRPPDRIKIGVFEILVEAQLTVTDTSIATAIDEPMPAAIKQELRSLTGPAVRAPETRPDGLPQTGLPQTGSPQTGSPQTGLPQTGSPQTGSRAVGSPQTGSPQTGSPQTGSPQTGSPQTGSRQTGSRRTGPPPPMSGARSGDSAISNATIIRSLSDLSAELGLDGVAGSGDSSAIRQSKRRALDEAYSSHLFGFLTRLARLLITTESDDEILRHVMEIVFDALPVDRGFILLRDEDSGELECELVRLNNQVEFRPTGVVPISKTMLESVISERVALLTYDALSDQRLAGTESVRIHQIRAAMCAPLWSGEKIIGVMQVDSPHHAGSFTEPDVDLLATLANYCAVAIERNRHAREAELQRELRSRLERYHSPAVIEEVMQEGTSTGGEAFRRLKQAEVSVLYADIVGFTAYSEKAQPEEVAELMEGYFTHAVEAIFENGGTLDKFIGDCVMAFFGAPMSQDDHARRAVRAALRFSRALEGWNGERRRSGLSPIASRIGINSGPVVVGDVGSKRRVDYTVLGNTVNVASRLEDKVASPGDIVIGEATQRLLGDEFRIESLGEQRLKGLSVPIVAYRVVW